MAEILALGLTHFPLLSLPDESWTRFLPAMLRNPELDPSWQDQANWPAPMSSEWSSDEGKSAAAAHRSDILDWMRRTRAALDDFKPDFVLIWGDDQYENFLEDCVPAYCVNAHDDFSYHPPKGNIWGEADDTVFKVPGVKAAGKALTKALINAGFDTAYSYKPLHDDLGHAFTNAILFLDYDRRGFDYPILPFSLNSYGSRVLCQKGGYPDFTAPPLAEDDLDPPGPTPWRLFDLGGEVARFLAASPWRVALIASSGWSHGFLTPKHQFLYPDVPADRHLYDALVAGDYAAWRNYPAAAIEDAGQQEVLNWMCLAGALDALGRGPGTTGFLETWVFNSSKVFLISPPGTAQ